MAKLKSSNEEIRTLIQTDPNYVNLSRYSCDLKKVLDRYPDGCPDHVIANALGVKEEDVPGLYQTVVFKLRSLLNV